jgi:diguanylate cyclase (GGDEF)-like protein
MTPWWLPLAFLGGGIVGWLAGRRGRAAGSPSADGVPADLHQVLDLLRRAHGAAVGCLVRAGTDAPITVDGTTGEGDLAARAEATARVALGDRRQHVIGDPHTIVAVGDGEFGVALAWEGSGIAPEQVDAAHADQRRLLGGFRSREAAWSTPSGPPGVTATVPEALESVAFAICEAARAISECPTAVVLRDPEAQSAMVVAVSHGADRRLMRSPVAPESVAGRACMGEVPIVGTSGKDLFGQLRRDRRQHEERGVAFPLHDGRQGVGALIVFVEPGRLSGDAQRRLSTVTADGGPRLAVAAAIRAAELRAQTDELTGLGNRRALERVMQAEQAGECVLALLDLDHFKKLNDSFGHTAGDAMLRHVARVLRATLREQDLAARVGGEEFALWLPTTSLATGREVAERVRGAIGGSRLYWAGADLAITGSLGLAGKPETTGQAANLYSAADAALYRAKEGGRNRVEVALPSR